MSVTTINQTVKIEDVRAVSYTGVEFDEATGEWVREVRVFAPYGTEDKKLIFSLQVRSLTREGIEMTTPPLSI